MAIIDNRLSTEVLPDVYLDPDGRYRHLNQDYEDGPIAIQDVSKGTKYQPWKLSFLAGVFTVTPEITGPPVSVLTGQTSQQCSLAFDQNGYVSILWTDENGLCNLWWYDTVAQARTITPFPDVHHGMLSYDDKRVMQVGPSDVLFWYTRQIGQQYNLYHRRQRDRYDDEFLMAEDVFPYIRNTGMHKSLRGQIYLTSSPL